MIPINNSNTAWLIVSDWNQENGKFYEELRKDVLEVNVNDWYFKGGDSVQEVGGFAVGELVGTNNGYSNYVGFVGHHGTVGDAADRYDTLDRVGKLVGGNPIVQTCIN